MEMKISLSTAKNWIVGFNKKGEQPFSGFEGLSSKKLSCTSPESSSSSSKGKAVLRGSEFEELNKRLKALEEETETMKKAFFWSLEERRVMMKEIYKQFQLLNSNGCLALEESSSSVKSFEEFEIETMSSDQNPTLISKELRINPVAFQELDTYRGHIKFHHD